MITTNCSHDESQCRARLLSMGQEGLGKLGESIWKNVLADSDWYYVPLARICDGGAPLAKKSSGALILPDYDACRNGRSIFVEVKAKSQSIFYRIRGKERHGINERNYIHYRQIAQEYGKKMAIAIVELQSERKARDVQWSGSLLIQTFNELGRAEPSHPPETPPKVYWDRKAFRELEAGLSARELCHLATGKLRRDYSFELDNIFFPATQREMF